MKKLLIPVITILFFLTCINSSFGRSFWRTYEIQEISENSLTLVDNEGNSIVVDKDPQNYKIGYKVRYDRVKNILKRDIWQDYTVADVSDDSITLEHKSGDILKIENVYEGDFNKGDSVSYDSIGNELRLTEDLGK